MSSADNDYLQRQTSYYRRHRRSAVCVVEQSFALTELSVAAEERAKRPLLMRRGLGGAHLSLIPLLPLVDQPWRDL